jgi:hypothetical protein
MMILVHAGAQDSSRSSTFYMRGVVEHSINVPDSVALSSSESEYREACSACMASNSTLETILGRFGTAFCRLYKEQEASSDLH